jgi:predicted Zn-dependent protease
MLHKFLAKKNNMRRARSSGRLHLMKQMISRRLSAVLIPLRPQISLSELIDKAKRRLRRLLRFTQPDAIGTYVYATPVTEKLLGRHLLNPILWFKWSTAFAIHWAFSRPYSSCLVAIPAMFLGATLLAVVVFSTSNQSLNRENQYRSFFDEAVKSRDFELAAVVVKELIDGSPQNLELKYQQALLEQHRGNTDAAIKQMDDLAVLNNHGLAAMWMISQECKLQELKRWSKQEHARFRKWIEIGLNNLEGENLLSAKVLMFSYLAEVGALGDAGKLIADVVPARPELALAAATLCRSQLDDAGVSKYANIAERHFESVLSRQPTDINARINLARVLMIQTKFELAAKLLNDGYRLTKDNRLTGVTAEALVVWSNHLGAGDVNAKNLVKRLQILHAAMGIAPSDSTVGSSIAQLIIDCRDNRAPEVVRLKEAILKGADPVSNHFIRGTLALIDDKVDEAKKQLELAFQREPNIPAVLNNLSIALAATKNDGDVEKALTMVDLALAKLPNHVYFLETRGQILLKLNRWHEAISDLEAALEARELRSAIYPSLALAYDKTGAPELASVYRKLQNGVAAD